MAAGSLDATDPWMVASLVGDLVALRQIGEQDLDAAWEMINDLEGADLTATTQSFERAQVDEWYRSRPVQTDRLDLAIVECATNEFAGEVVLNEFDADRNTANFRISMRGPAWFGRGLGTEATQLIVEHGIQTIGLSSIELDVLARNPRARRVYEKVGFETVEERYEDGEDWVVMRFASR